MIDTQRATVIWSFSAINQGQLSNEEEGRKMRVLKYPRKPAALLGCQYKSANQIIGHYLIDPAFLSARLYRRPWLLLQESVGQVYILYYAIE